MLADRPLSELREESKCRLIAHGKLHAGWTALYQMARKNRAADSETLHRVVGPAIRQPEQWSLPVLANDSGDYNEVADKLRRNWGLEPASI